jgi:hypothetical protein
MWKVVMRQPRGTLTSVVARRFLRVKYVPGEWVEAKIGGLLAFSNLENAREFVEVFNGATFYPFLQIWRCEVADPVALPDGGLYYFNLRASFARRLWSGGRPRQTIEWPAGTAAFRRIKLIEKI